LRAGYQGCQQLFCVIIHDLGHLEFFAYRYRFNDSPHDLAATLKEETKQTRRRNSVGDLSQKKKTQTQTMADKVIEAVLLSMTSAILNFLLTGTGSIAERVLHCFLAKIPLI
jgi:hypothetical protein